MNQGYLCLVLHAHLPFVRHPEEEYFLEENWLYEAITETYIPLIHVFERLLHDRVYFRITMSLTPTLCSMLLDPLLQDRYLKYLSRSIELAEKEIERTKFDSRFHGLAWMYFRKLMATRETFLHYEKNLVTAFKNFQEEGSLEILASSATHGFSPLLSVQEQSVRAQIQIGVEYYRQVFGVQPKGFWLPECGFYPGLDFILKEAGIRYFFVDSHGLVNADPVPRYSVYAPVYCPTSGVAAFGRDWECSKQVWSSKEGYPGDPDYREYYKDIGFELDFDYIKPYIHPQGIRINTGFKYWRITGGNKDKEPYIPEWAREKAAMHSGDFIWNRQRQIENLSFRMDRKPVIVAPYDAELFGHWWFEGPLWLDYLMRQTAYDQNTVKMITPSEYLNEYPTNQLCSPSASSWGFKGYNDYWLTGQNDWIYRHLFLAGERMIELAEKFKDSRLKNKLIHRALNLAARELLLAQSSDWPFIMRSGTMVPYAEKRIKLHLNRLTRLYNDLLNNTLDESWILEVEQRDNLFENLDCFAWFLANSKSVSMNPIQKSSPPVSKTAPRKSAASISSR